MFLETCPCVRHWLGLQPGLASDIWITTDRRMTKADWPIMRKSWSDVWMCCMLYLVKRAPVKRDHLPMNTSFCYMFKKELNYLLPLPFYEDWPQKPIENLPLSTDLMPPYTSYIIPSVVFLSRSEFMYMVEWYNTCTSANVIWAYNSFVNNLRIDHVFIKYLKMSC